MGHIVVHIQAKYQKDQTKTEGAYTIGEIVEWRTARYQISFSMSTAELMKYLL